MCNVNKTSEKQGPKECPVCKGEKVITGICSCNMEWRGTQLDEDEWEDCKCTPTQTCSTCHGTGIVN